MALAEREVAAGPHAEWPMVLASLLLRKAVVDVLDHPVIQR